MTGTTSGSEFGALLAEALVLLVAGLLPPLFLVGLGYRFWRWTKTPDESTAKKQAARREQLKRVARRPALEMPVHSALLPEGDDIDPVLNAGDEHEA